MRPSTSVQTKDFYLKKIKRTFFTWPPWGACWVDRRTWIMDTPSTRNGFVNTCWRRLQYLYIVLKVCITFMLDLFAGTRLIHFYTFPAKYFFTNVQVQSFRMYKYSFLSNKMKPGCIRLFCWRSSAIIHSLQCTLREQISMHAQILWHRVESLSGRADKRNKR